jgi:hypothetical protein
MSEAKQKYSEPGPWDDEPDELDFTDERTGYACRILRNHSGALCGYVQVPPDHPLHGVAYNASIDASLMPLMESVMEGTVGKRSPIQVLLMSFGERSPGDLFDVHGGITFSGDMRGAAEGSFWYGFDCSHCDDASPKYLDHGLRGTYRDLAYVKAECASLAKQIKQVVS